MKILTVFGTRPEAIKMIPVVRALQAEPSVEVEVCVTGQHRQMLDQVLELFAVKPDYDLNVMKSSQGLTSTTCSILTGLEGVLKESRPARVLVHGDTATALAASIAAYYQGIRVGHVEAGLRSGDNYQPWPEEVNRRVVDVISDHFYAPTAQARDNLLAENIPASRIHVTGNTVIDALFATLRLIEGDATLRGQLEQRFAFLKPGRKLLLVTGHRRENFGAAFKDMCAAIGALAAAHDIDVVYPVHLNPEVQRPVHAILGNRPNVHLIAPLDYLPFVYLMNRAEVILTDSGGIQEEAPSLGKPVFVMRNVTERPEAIASGAARLVGTDPARIVANVGEVLTNSAAYAAMSGKRNPYGDGHAATRIARIIAGHRTEIETREVAQ